MVEVAQTDYPREVRDMYDKLNRDEVTARRELDLILSLKDQIILVYGLPPASGLPRTGVKNRRSTAGNADMDPGTECPLSDDAMRKLADPVVILEALAQELPDARVKPTASARWMTSAGVVDKNFRTYRVTLRRLMEKNPGTWRKEGDGWFTHIPTEARIQAEKETLQVPGNGPTGNNGLCKENAPSLRREQKLGYDDSLT